MANCLDCKHCINGSTPVCNLEGKVFPIDNVNVASTCANYADKPLLTKKHKEKQAEPAPTEKKPKEPTINAVSLKSGAGWIVAFFLLGIVIYLSLGVKV